MKRLIVFLAIVVLNIFFTVVLLASIANAAGWRTVGVTAYAQFEANLTGCSGSTDPHNGKPLCYTACRAFPHLHDNEMTVAANPRMGLRCGDKVTYLKWADGKFWRHNATVTDTTACTLWFCDFEFSYALARATGASKAGWDNPRHISYQKGWKPAKRLTARFRNYPDRTVLQTCPGALLSAKYHRLSTWRTQDRLQESPTTAGYRAGHRTRSCRAAKQQAKNWRKRDGTKYRQLTNLNRDSLAAIDYVFGPRGLAEEAKTVARCESGFSTGASNGQFQGIFQLGDWERAQFAVWKGGYRYTTAVEQVRAADRMQRARGWGSWQCSEHGGLRW